MPFEHGRESSVMELHQTSFLDDYIMDNFAGRRTRRGSFKMLPGGQVSDMDGYYDFCPKLPAQFRK